MTLNQEKLGSLVTLFEGGWRINMTLIDLNGLKYKTIRKNDNYYLVIEKYDCMRKSKHYEVVVKGKKNVFTYIRNNGLVKYE